jgi:hypothetical protein
MGTAWGLHRRSDRDLLMAFAAEHPSTRWLADLLGEGGTSTGKKVAP